MFTLRLNHTFLLPSYSMLTKRSINYAAFDGIKKSELPAAIVFVVVYIPFFLFYIFQSFKRPTYVYKVLVLFCLGEWISRPLACGL